MRCFASFILFVLSCNLSLAQGKLLWLKKKLQDVDTVLLVSHEITDGVSMVDENGNNIPLPPLIVNGKPNSAIIKEQLQITGADLNELITILATPNNDIKVVVGRCFMPHHAIFIVKNGITSYIDICFGCHNFESSKDLIKMTGFNDHKWNKLYEYFVRKGLKYKLGTDEIVF